jgi:prolyl 4-hydroxylase
MIDVKAAVGRIETLLSEGSAASLTYAALEARIALERLGYDHVRRLQAQAQDEAEERVQPQQRLQLVKQIIADGASLAAHASTVSVRADGAQDAPVGSREPAAVFDPQAVGLLWQNLTTAALHARNPENAADPVAEFGEGAIIKAHVQQALAELRRLSAAPAAAGDLGPELSWDCACGTNNNRFAAMLRDGQHVSCSNPRCNWTWVARGAGSAFQLQPLAAQVVCKACARPDTLPLGWLRKLKFGDSAKWNCPGCAEENQARLVFSQLANPNDADRGDQWMARVAFSTTVKERLLATPGLTKMPTAKADIFFMEHFVSEAECAGLVALIDQQRQPSQLLAPSPDPEFRTSDSCNFGRSESLVQAIEAKIDALTGIPAPLGETMQGQRYAIGQQFKAHHDFFHTSEPYWPENEKRGGQRTWTVMLFLNEPAAGGRTVFPEAGIEVVPKRGALLAWNNLDALGEPNHRTLHQAMPVESGVKYVITKWYRERPWS